MTVDAAELARALIQRDQEDDEGSKFGQSVRKTFPHADFFLDAGTDLRRQIERLITVLFGHPQVSPSRDEYAMFMAQAAALRSADMSRQVGAVIVDGDGEVVAAGCNEVPKPGGGVYWSGDKPDHRDFTQGSDPNTLMGREILGEVFGRLKDAGWLVEAKAEQEPAALVEAARGLRMFERARIDNLIEFGRVVHAEMNALIYAARHGREVGNPEFYCTTFPCHVCARHLIGAGLSSVVYIEPYPKSLAVDLYPEAIALETKPEAVAFIPFTGVAPRRYMDFFGFGRRKDTHGYAVQWQPRRARPRPRPLGSPYLLPSRSYAIPYSRRSKPALGSSRHGALMSEKTPRQLLRESLERNAEEVASWPSWMRTAISTKGMFSVPSPDEVSGRGERIGASPGAQPQPEK